jgi:polysaccharide biosynthesis PFTS motif protein
MPKGRCYLLNLYSIKFLKDFRLRLGFVSSNYSAENTGLRRHFLRFAKTHELENLRNMRREICELEKKENDSSEIDDPLHIAYKVRVSQRQVNLLLTSQAFSQSFCHAKETDSSLWYPLPRRWVPLVEKHGYRVNRVMSYSMYSLVCMYLLFRNLFLALKMVISKPQFFQSEFIENLNRIEDERTFMVGISDNDVIEQNNIPHFKNFGNWIATNSEKLKLNSAQSKLYFPGESNQSRTSILFPKFKDRFGTCGQALSSLPRSSFMEFLEIISWISYIEILTSWCIRTNVILKKGTGDKVLIFNNSQKNDKPIWAELLDQAGARVCLMFYSTEMEPTFLSSRNPPIEYWGLAKWNEYWFVDALQRDRFRGLNYLSEAKELIVGYPWWSDNNYKLSNARKKVVTFFSLEPHRSDFSLAPNYSYGFGDPQQAIKTLKDILEICEEFGYVLRHKVKRHLTSERYPEYTEAIESFKLHFSDVYESTDPKTSVSRLIDSSDFVISSPFTTTGEEACQVGKPSIYYVHDIEFPINTISLSEVGLKRDKVSLREWLQNNT